jgi:protease II
VTDTAVDTKEREAMNDSERRRNDPEIRAKVEEIHKARQAMLLKAEAQLEEIVNEMRALTQYGDDAIYNRCYDAVWDAQYKVGNDARFMQRIGGETYVGNLAAGELGEIIEKSLRTKKERQHG